MKSICAVLLVSLTLATAHPSHSSNECATRPKVRPMACCSMIPAMIDQAAMGACTTAFSATTPSMDPSCVAECYLKEMSVLKDGAMDKATALNAFGRSLDDNMKTVLATNMDTCMAKMEQYTEKTKSNGGATMGKCPREASILTGCLEMEMYKHCPADKMIMSDDCTAMAAYMEKCG